MDFGKELTLPFERSFVIVLQKIYHKLHVVELQQLPKGAIFSSNPVMTTRMAEESANEGGEAEKGGKSKRD